MLIRDCFMAVFDTNEATTESNPRMWTLWTSWVPMRIASELELLLPFEHAPKFHAPGKSALKLRPHNLAIRSEPIFPVTDAQFPRVGLVCRQHDKKMPLAEAVDLGDGAPHPRQRSGDTDRVLHGEHDTAPCRQDSWRPRPLAGAHGSLERLATWVRDRASRAHVAGEPR
jgi:hypothetical protein